MTMNVNNVIMAGLITAVVVGVALGSYKLIEHEHLRPKLTNAVNRLIGEK